MSNKRKRKSNEKKTGFWFTFATSDIIGLAGNSTSLAFNIVWFSNIAACDWLCP